MNVLCAVYQRDYRAIIAGIWRLPSAAGIATSAVATAAMFVGCRLPAGTFLDDWLPSASVVWRCPGGRPGGEGAWCGGTAVTSGGQGVLSDGLDL